MAYVDVDVYFDLLEEAHGYDFKSRFHALSATQRLGQAFYNCLPIDDARKLRASDVDCFYQSDWGSIQIAIDFLTRSNNVRNSHS